MALDGPRRHLNGRMERGFALCSTMAHQRQLAAIGNRIVVASTRYFLEYGEVTAEMALVAFVLFGAVLSTSVTCSRWLRRYFWL